MKLVIMQPYFLPYLGYYQLIEAADTFIIYDDVNYIKQGWINRNRIICNKNEFLFTLQIKGASSFRKINELEVGDNKSKLLQTFLQSYAKAPYYERILPLLIEIFSFDATNLSKFIYNSIQKISSFLEIQTNLKYSSHIKKEDSLKGQDKVIHICKLLGADCYINSIGGKELYSKEEFAKHQVKLMFLNSKPFVYKNSISPFIPYLSILDVLMYNPKEQIMEELQNVELI